MSDARPLRILMVSARFFPSGGGTELHTREVATRLAARGHDVTVLTTNPGSLPAREELNGVHVRRVRPWTGGSDLYFAPDVYRVVRRGGWVPLGPTLGRTLASAVTLGGGGSAGSEGPVAVLGAAAGSALWSNTRRML